MPDVATAHTARLALIASLVTVTLTGTATAQSTAEIDRQVWQAVAASAANHDIVAMGRVYHPAAVLVSNTGTTPIASALERWGKDMVTARANGAKASVAFRFTRRQDDATTAFEAGAFRYATTDKAGVETPGYVRFEALLVKTPDGWRMVMERQLDAITEAQWNALPR
jgi:ketosteroid isomerase-like protein